MTRISLLDVVLSLHAEHLWCDENVILASNRRILLHLLVSKLLRHFLQQHSYLFVNLFGHNSFWSS